MRVIRRPIFVVVMIRISHYLAGKWGNNFRTLNCSQYYLEVPQSHCVLMSSHSSSRVHSAPPPKYKYLRMDQPSKERSDAISYKGGAQQRAASNLGSTDEHPVFEAELMGAIMGIRLLMQEKMDRYIVNVDNQTTYARGAKHFRGIPSTSATRTSRQKS